MPSLIPPTTSFNRQAPPSSGHIIALPNRNNSLISIDHIAQTGRVPVNGWLGTLFNNPDLRVDLKADDAYTQALQKMITQAEEKLRSNSDVIALLAKPEWNRTDRVVWEKTLADTMAQEMRSIPGLDSYRTEPPKPSFQTHDVKRDPLVNQVAQDILNPHDPKFEFDCEQMSLTLGLAMHFTERRMLPPAVESTTLRAAQNYYYAVGQSHSLPPAPGTFTLAPEVARDPIGGHAILVSGATGNFIEATNNNPDRFNPGYKHISTPGYNFETFLRTGIAVLDSRTVFADTADMNRAVKASETEALISWCVRKVEDYGNEKPEICNTTAVDAVLRRNKTSEPS